MDTGAEGDRIPTKCPSYRCLINIRVSCICLLYAIATSDTTIWGYDLLCLLFSLSTDWITQRQCLSLIFVSYKLDTFLVHFSPLHFGFSFCLSFFFWTCPLRVPILPSGVVLLGVITTGFHENQFALSSLHTYTLSHINTAALEECPQK